jgi:hypothetical protein
VSARSENGSEKEACVQEVIRVIRLRSKVVCGCSILMPTSHGKFHYGLIEGFPRVFSADKLLHQTTTITQFETERMRLEE